MKRRLEAIATAFERLSSREQVTTIFLVMALLGMIVGFGGYFINKDFSRRKQRIASKTEMLREVAALRGDYQRRLAEQNRIAEEVRRNDSLRILTYLEELSQRAHIDLGNASERAGENTGSDQVKEVAAEVMVQNVSLDRLNEFLLQIEQGNRLVKVRRLKIKTRFDNSKMLDATITVGTFKPGAPGASG